MKEEDDPNKLDPEEEEIANLPIEIIRAELIANKIDTRPGLGKIKAMIKAMINKHKPQ